MHGNWAWWGCRLLPLALASTSIALRRAAHKAHVGHLATPFVGFYAPTRSLGRIAHKGHALFA